MSWSTKKTFERGKKKREKERKAYKEREMKTEDPKSRCRSMGHKVISIFVKVCTCDMSMNLDHSISSHERLPTKKKGARKRKRRKKEIQKVGLDAWNTRHIPNFFIFSRKIFLNSYLPENKKSQR